MLMCISPGADRLLSNVREMIGFMPRPWMLYKIAWCFLTPAVNSVSRTRLKVNTYLS